MQTQYRIRYEYVNPSPAGPYRGVMVSTNKHDKGDIIRGCWGRAEVVSCRAVQRPGNIGEALASFEGPGLIDRGL